MNKLQILYTTDIHGSLFSHNYVDGKNNHSGLTRLSTLVRMLRASNPDLILIDNGDINQGTPLVTYDQKNANHQLMSLALNALGYDYANLGNHDFNYGIENLLIHLQNLDADLLTSNIEVRDQVLGETKLHPTPFGVIAFIGVVTDYLHNWEQPDTLKQMKIKTVLETVQQEVAKVKDRADHIVVLYHGGLERDPDTLEPTEALTGENIGIQLAFEVPEIDVLLTGHQHRTLVKKVNNTLIIQAGNEAQKVGLVEFDEDGFHGKIIELGPYATDPTFEQPFLAIEQETQLWLDDVIGYSDKPLIVTDLVSAQKNFHPLACFLNQVILEYTGAEVALSSFFNTTFGFDTQITYRQLIANYPFPNTLFVKEVPGIVLLEYLEKNATYWSKDDQGHVVVSPDKLIPKLQYYDYDFVTGVQFDIDVSKPIGQRIINHQIDLNKTYRVVMNNYRAQGGSHSFMLRDCATVFEDGREVIDILYDYLIEHQPIEIKETYLTKVF